MTRPPGRGGRHRDGGHRSRHGDRAGSSRPQYGAPFWQRRFLRTAVTIATAWVAAGIVFGVLFGDRHGQRQGPPSRAIIPVVVAVAVLATIVAYRRIARPVSTLLGSAASIGNGDYRARVRPEGPRSVRALGDAFNEMASRLETSETARRRFLADVTHELKTPLTVLQAGIEAQLDGIHARDDDHLATLLEQTRTLSRLVEDLRTLTVGDAGQLRIAREPTTLDDVVGDAVAAMSNAAAERSVTLAVAATTPDAPVAVRADHIRLVQVLTNLVANAIRHTPQGGTVTIGIETGAGGATVTVDDTGPGIDGDPERLFDRFHRAADSGGSGLGLTIARQLISAHGGTITASNRVAIDGTRLGARFVVTLPSGDVEA